MGRASKAIGSARLTCHIALVCLFKSNLFRNFLCADWSGQFVLGKGLLGIAV